MTSHGLRRRLAGFCHAVRIRHQDALPFAIALGLDGSDGARFISGSPAVPQISDLASSCFSRCVFRLEVVHFCLLRSCDSWI